MQDQKRHRLLVVIKGLGLGGAERLLVSTLPKLNGQGFAVEVGYFLPWKDALVADLEAAGVVVTCFAEKGRFNWRAVKNYLWFLRQQRFDLVHAHLPVPGILSRLIKPFVGFKLVYTEHNVWGRLGLLSRWLNRLTYGLNDQAISCSEEVRRSTGRRGIVLDNAVDVSALQQHVPAEPGLRELYGVEATVPLVVCVANLTPKKNHRNLLNAFAMLAQEGIPGQLVLIGQDGTCRGDFEVAMAELRLQSRVTFHGPSDDVVGLLADADVFCLSSDYEGLPISLLEAMALAIPPVCTSVGGIPSVIRDGQDGLLVPPRDAEALAAALKKLLISSEMRQEIGDRACRRVIERYDMPVMIEKLEAVYDDLLT